MSIWKNGKLIAGGSQALPLLTFMWADHQLNHPSWLRADTFSWQSGAVYTAAYAHLADDITGKTLQSETVGGITVQFYLADDGHKICPASEESNVLSIYNATGVAWYYIIDTTNQRFKLPRTQFGFTGLRDTVGGYVPESLPNIVAEWNSIQTVGNTASGAFYYKGSTGGSTGTSHSGGDRAIVGFDASLSSSTYQDSAPVQQKATQMYLYFYVGQFTQTALENTAGVTTETLNGKVDKGHQVVAFQEPTADNNFTWYRKYADGWVEQGSMYTVTTSSPHTITLPVAMADTDYSIMLTVGMSSGGDATVQVHVRTDMITTTSFGVAKQWTSSSGFYYWQVSGMAAN